MSSIGSGPGLASGANIEVASALQVGATDTRQTTTLDATTSLPQATTGTQSTTTTDSSAAPAVVTDTASTAGAIPQDSDRVAAIKKAIESGQYPIVPTKIGDAMIAASMLWRSPK